MKRQVIFGTMLSAALAVGISAQQPTTGTGASGSSQGEQTRSGSPRSGAEVTLTGCLQSGER